MRRGLGVIAARAEALSRFMAAYARLARLPPPQPRPVRCARPGRPRGAPRDAAARSPSSAGPDVTSRPTAISSNSS